MVLAMGLVFVLLLGEIDLSAGFTAGMGAAILATTLTERGWAWPLSLLAALATGVLIGFAIAVLVARLGIPSFVVTLAFFLALQGAMLLIIGEGGTIPIRNEAILSVMNDNMPGRPRLAAGAGHHRRVRGRPRTREYGRGGRRTCRRRRCRCGGSRSRRWPWSSLAAVYLLNQERQRSTAVITIQGVPWVVPLVVALVVGLSFALTRTAFGRHVYAVGGNAEAARRAGINVANIETACFIIGSVRGDRGRRPARVAATTPCRRRRAARRRCCTRSARRSSAAPASSAVAAAVYDAVTGGLVVAVIANGLPLGHPAVRHAVHRQRRGSCWWQRASMRSRGGGRPRLADDRGRGPRRCGGGSSPPPASTPSCSRARARRPASRSSPSARATARAASSSPPPRHRPRARLLRGAARRRRRRGGLHPAAELAARAVVDQGAAGRQARPVREAADSAARPTPRRRSTPPSAPGGC